MMKRAARAGMILAVVMVATGILATSSAQAQPSPFIGRWESIDIDGSFQTLAIGGGPRGTFRFAYHDRGATVCGVEDGEILYAGIARGRFTAAGNVLSANTTLTCLSRPRSVIGPFDFIYTYDPGTDTMTDVAGALWTRR